MGCTVPFYYNGETGVVKIVDVYYPEEKIKIEYNGKEKVTSISCFRSFSIVKFLGLIHTEYEFEIGHRIVDEKRNIEIIEVLKNPKPYLTKGYLCKCLNCNYEFISTYYKLTSTKRGCACCSNSVVVAGVNSIADREPWMVNYFVDKEDAKKYMPSSKKSVKVKCPDCNEEKCVLIEDLYKNHSIGCHCGDNVSFAEKFIFQLFKELEINFVWQASRTTFKWINNLIKYDFYLPDYNCIVEVHGQQHYKPSKFKRTLEEEQQNDKQKKELALTNGISNYIVINCENVLGNAILNNIKRSSLLEFLNYRFEDINWSKCFEKAVTSMDKKICEYFKEHPDKSTGELGEILGFKRSKIKQALLRGTEIGWCNYDSIVASKNIGYKTGKYVREKTSIPFEVYKDGVLVGLFFNVSDLEKYSREHLPYLLSKSRVADVYNGHRESYRGFTFKKISQEEYNNREENKGCLNINLD